MSMFSEVIVLVGFEFFPFKEKVLTVRSRISVCQGKGTLGSGSGHGIRALRSSLSLGFALSGVLLQSLLEIPLPPSPFCSAPPPACFLSFSLSLLNK